MKLPYRLLFVLPVALLTAACTESHETHDLHPVGRAVTRRPGHPNLYAVSEDDREMEQATREARRTVGQFITALQHPTAGQRDFQVKKLFIKDGEAEHIWLADVHFTGNRLHGVVDNRPVKIPGLKVGDKASVNPDEISDWSYVENGQLVGGYTIRVLFQELSPTEREQFERQAGFHLAAQ